MLGRLGESHPLGVITNTHHAPLVLALLADFGLARHFSLVLMSVEHGRRKPCRSIFDAAVEHFSTVAERCIYIGDSFEPDYLGAINAGLQAWLIDPRCEADVPAQHRLLSILDVEARLA